MKTLIDKTKEIGLPLPKTHTQEVLLTLISQKRVSIMDFPYMSGFRTRVSEITNLHGLTLERKMIKSFNKFGNSYVYALHRLKKKSEIEKAKKIYLKMVGQ